jgi:hypothetical protein
MVVDIFAEEIHNIGFFRPRTDKAHHVPYYGEELLQFVEAELAQILTQFSHCPIAFLGTNRSGLRKQKRCVCVTTMAVTIGAVIYVAREPTRYRAEALLASDSIPVEDYLKDNMSQAAVPRKRF